MVRLPTRLSKPRTTSLLIRITISAASMALVSSGASVAASRAASTMAHVPACCGSVGALDAIVRCQLATTDSVMLKHGPRENGHPLQVSPLALARQSGESNTLCSSALVLSRWKKVCIRGGVIAAISHLKVSYNVFYLSTCEWSMYRVISHLPSVIVVRFQNRRDHMILWEGKMLMSALMLSYHFVAADIERVPQLKSRLLSSYGSTSTRPGLSHAAHTATCDVVPPDEVRVQVYIEKSSPLDMVAGSFGFDGYLRAWWTDPRLRFNGTANGGCVDKLSLSEGEMKQVWKPVFYWEGALKIKMPEVEEGTGALLEIYPDGTIWWSRQVAFLLNCPFQDNLEFLPFDTQKCTFRFGMYADTAFDTYLRWKEERLGMENLDGQLSSSACLSEWFVTNYAQQDKLLVYESANYTYAEAYISYSRSPSTMVQSYLLPSSLFCMMSYLGFFIDPMATPARITLAMLAIVVAANSFLGLVQSLPTTSKPTWLSQFLLSCIYINVLCMIEVVLVSFGMLSVKWLNSQTNMLQKGLPWRKALALHSEQLVKLFREWDIDGSGTVSKLEFRKGVTKMGVFAQKVEINALFDEFAAHNEDGSEELSISELEALFNSKQSNTHSCTAHETGHQGPTDEHLEEQIANDLLPEATRLPEIEPRLDEGRRTGSVHAHGQNPTCNISVISSPPRAASEKAIPAALVAVSGEKMSAIRTRMSHESHAIRKIYSRRAVVDLDKSRIWVFKVYYLFPVLVKLKHADHVARVLFPLFFAIFLMVELSKVDMNSHQKLLERSSCYTRVHGS